MASNTNAEEKPWFLKSKFPVLFPTHEALAFSDAEFEKFVIEELVKRFDDEVLVDASAEKEDTADIETLVTDSTTADVQKGVDKLTFDDATETDGAKDETKKDFVSLLKETDSKEDEVPDMTGKMFTENGDVTHSTTGNTLVDLFSELEAVISGPRLQELLDQAWREDPLMTLKIIFNARSIHLGKSSKNTFYRCAGWLAQNHPATLVANLAWLARPVIEKKQKMEDSEEVELVEKPKEEDDPLRFDVKNGVAHGYWKDLLNMLALAANDELKVLGDPARVLNPENPDYLKSAVKRHKRKGTRPPKGSLPTKRRRGAGGDSEAGEKDEEAEKPKPPVSRKTLEEPRRANAEDKFNNDPVYRTLHLAVARLFAKQLETDLAALRGDDVKAKRTLSLCGKWAPSHDRFHDRHTIVVSTIAEILHPREKFDHVLSASDERETYLRHAREEYRRDVSALRKHLDVVERHISANKLEDIKYDRVPSVAMSNYSGKFIKDDFDRFEKYLDNVASGKANISGAVLFPSLLVKKQRNAGMEVDEEDLKNMNPKEIVAAKIQQMETRVVGGQWNTLVQRIKDSGTLESCIAVADVSGSMCSPTFPDGSSPMDSSIALSLLVAEVTKPPFGGSFITFHNRPEIVTVDLESTFAKKVEKIERASWGMSTDLEAVFELLLKTARKHSLKQEDMVKRVLIFSDMQFNSAIERGTQWSTTMERVKSKWDTAGFELPELVFWNLAGGRGGPAPKPVTMEENRSLVSGYSQGMLKMFLDNGGFEDVEEADEEEEVVVLEKGEDGEVKEVKKKKAKTDPLKTVRKAIGHEAYGMLRVVD